MAGTTNIPLTSTGYVSLGNAPLLVQALGGNISIIVADTQPSGAPGGANIGYTILQNEFQVIQQADSGSVVWGAAPQSGSASVTPILPGTSGGGGAVTIADGADTAEGATTATAYSDGTGAAAGTVVGLLKGLFVELGTKITAVSALPTGGVGIIGWLSRLYSQLPATLGQTTKANSLAVTLPSDMGSLAVTPTPTSSATTTTAVTAGTSSNQGLASGTRKFLAISNESASAFVAFSLGGTAALNTSGSKTLAPMNSFTFDADFVPSDAINVIASAASTPVTIWSA